MRNQLILSLTVVALAGILSPSTAMAAKPEPPAPAELTAKGQQLEAAYAAEMKTLKEEIQRAVSTIDASKKEAYQKSLEAETDARSKFSSAQQATGGVQQAENMVNHAKGKWIVSAQHGIKAAEKKLKDAKNDGQRKAAQVELEKWQKNLADGQSALKMREEALEMAKRAKTEGPKMIMAAEKELARVKAETKKVFQQIGMGKLLDEGALDAKLVKYVVLMEGTPRGLAEFASKSEKHAALISQLLSDTDLMRQMLVADGAQRQSIGRGFGPAQYGPAMEIHTAILRQAPDAKGVLRELALAIALEHSIPIIQTNPEAITDGPSHVDPVKRYQYFVKAYLDGELDSAFKQFNVWELRMVVDGNEPDETLTWGRQMMRNYQPAHVMTSDYGWRYVRVVATDVKYGSGDVQYDRPELQNYQNIIMNGGICGRRAFFGRFILRAFGIPTTPRPSRGHAALAHWTPKGWVVNLGPGWGGGWTQGTYNQDRNFLASTQGRANPGAYLGVKRAMWIGDTMGEPRVYGMDGQGPPQFWNALSLQLQRSVIEDSNAGELAALGAEIGESNAAPQGPDTVSESVATANDKEISVAANGAITIPAAAYDSSSSNGGEARIIKSFKSGLQVNIERFDSEGVTVLRGGTWKSDPNASSSGTRLLSGGFGRYDNWGFRAAMFPPSGSTAPKEVKLDLGKGVSMEFVYIKPGSFTMGGENTKSDRFNCVEVPKHEVTLTKGFYMGKYEVTQAQYQAIMGTNPSGSTKDPNCPADNIGEGEAVKFCELAATKTGQMIRLPYEAEWEYAARAGSSSNWFFGDSPAQMGDYAWFKDNADGKSHPVGQKKPNPWGLYDIYGNVCERILDRYHQDYYKESPKTDPTGPALKKKSLVTYSINAPRTGKYALSAKVVTNNYNQHLIATVNGGGNETMLLPFTLGDWQDSKPILVDLQQGKNTLQFHRITPPQAGIAVKAFTLTPVK